MKKRILALLIVFVMVVGFAACANNDPAPTTPAPETSPPAGTEPVDASDDPPVTFVWADSNAPGSIKVQMAQVFADRVAYLSGGNITIEIHHSAVLGAEPAVLDTMIGGGGTIQMARIPTFAFNPFGADMSRLLTVPFTFADRDHFWTFAASDLAAEIGQETLDLGIGLRTLFFAEEGFRHFYTSSPVLTVDDLQNMQIRTPNDPLLVGVVEALGANATIISPAEVYSAIQTGIVDGAENSVSTFVSNSQYEVAPYLAMSGHSLAVSQVVILEEVWQSLTENQRNVLLQAAEYTRDFTRELAESVEQEGLDVLRANDVGITVIEGADREPWLALAASVIEEHSGHMPELYQRILDLAG